MKDPQKNIGLMKHPQKKLWTNKYQREKILDPGNTLQKSFGPMKARWHGGTRPMRPTMARDSRNLAHSTDTGNQPEAS